MSMISFNRAMYEALREQYQTAVAAKLDQFVFVVIENPGVFQKTTEHPMVTDYAKYLLQHLEAEFAKPDQPRQPYNEGKEGE